MDDGQVLLLDLAFFPELPDLPRHVVAKCYQGEAARFTVQAVNEVKARAIPQVEAHPADQAGIFICLGGVANQTRWLVENQQLAVLVDNSQQRLAFDHAKPCYIPGRKRIQLGTLFPGGRLRLIIINSDCESISEQKKLMIWQSTLSRLAHPILFCELDFHPAKTPGCAAG